RDPALGERPYQEDPIEKLYDSTVMVTTRAQKRQLDEVLQPPERAAKRPAVERKEEIREEIREEIKEERKEEVKEEQEEKEEKERDPRAPGEAEKPVEAEKPFFDCERDAEATSLEDFVKEQRRPSKSVEFLRNQIGKGIHNGFVFSERDELLVTTNAEGAVKIVVPETLRAHVLGMHHNIQLAGHQGYKRTLEQIRNCFYWPGLKQDVMRWVRACMVCRKRKTPRP